MSAFEIRASESQAISIIEPFQTLKIKFGISKFVLDLNLLPERFIYSLRVYLQFFVILSVPLTPHYFVALIRIAFHKKA